MLLAILLNDSNVVFFYLIVTVIGMLFNLYLQDILLKTHKFICHIQLYMAFIVRSLVPVLF